MVLKTGESAGNAGLVVCRFLCRLGKAPAREPEIMSNLGPSLISCSIYVQAGVAGHCLDLQSQVVKHWGALVGEIRTGTTEYSLSSGTPAVGPFQSEMPHVLMDIKTTQQGGCYSDGVQVGMAGNTVERCVR